MADLAEKGRHYTTHEVSRICGVAPITVGRWVESGKLAAFRTAGGHRRIPASDLEEFLKSHGIPKARESGNNAPRILVVDDDADMIEVTKRMLAAANPRMEIRGASDGFMAGRLVESFRPQLMFLDLMMPGIDGFEVLRRLKSDPATEGVEIVGLTGFFTDENRLKLLEMGALDCLKKPAAAEQLLRILEKVFAAGE